jgi:hypothetical protein
MNAWPSGRTDKEMSVYGRKDLLRNEYLIAGKETVTKLTVKWDDVKLNACLLKWEEELIKGRIWPESRGCMRYWICVLEVNFALQSERNVRNFSSFLTFNTITGLLQFL